MPLRVAAITLDVDARALWLAARRTGAQRVGQCIAIGDLDPAMRDAFRRGAADPRTRRLLRAS